MNSNIKAFASLLLLLGIICHNAQAQYEYSETVFIGGPEFDSRSSFSAKLGITNIYVEKDCKWCFQAIYHQIQPKYNFTKNAVGLQTAVGYSLLYLGGRVGVDYEYNIDRKDSDFMMFVTGGIDIFGVASLQVGPKVNFTRNNASQAVLFHAAIDIPIGTFFQKGKLKEATQALRTARANRRAARK